MTTPSSARRRHQHTVIAGSVLAAVSLLVIWLVGVPSGLFVCPAIDPPPTSCRPSYRTGTATVMSAIVLLAFTLAVVVAFLRPTWRLAVGAGVVLMVAAPIVGYVLVASLPGFPLG